MKTRIALPIRDVRASANEIQTEAEALRDEVRAILAIVEDALRAACAPVKKAGLQRNVQSKCPFISSELVEYRCEDSRFLTLAVLWAVK